jgi:hypothetical protein
VLDLLDPVPGYFAGRYIHSWRGPVVPLANADGVYDSLRVLTNRARFGRDSTEYPALGYDRGALPEGALPDGLWERSDDATVLEVRIPWLLLNVTDPSERRVLLERRDARVVEEGRTGRAGTVQVDGIGVVVARRVGGTWTGLPAAGEPTAVARITWDSWDEPRWRARRRPTYHALQHTFAGLDTLATGDVRDRH